MGLPLAHIDTADSRLPAQSLSTREIEGAHGYKSAIARTLKTRGAKVGTDPHLCGLINSFYMIDQ